MKIDWSKQVGGAGIALYERFTRQDPGAIDTRGISQALFETGWDFGHSAQFGTKIPLVARWAEGGQDGGGVEGEGSGHTRNRMNNFRTILLVCSLVASSLQAQSWLTNGLACYLPFSGDTTDVSGNGNDGVNNGALPVEDRFGRTNSAYHFDGTNNYIEIQDSSAFKSTNFTISMWFKPERYPNIAVQDQAADMLISKGQNNFEIHTGSEVTGEAAMKFLPRYAISNDFSTSPNSFIVGRWQHVVAIYEPSTNQIHVLINGVEQQLTGPATRPMGADNNLSLWIGKRRDNSLAFKGALDDVRIYNRALTTNEAMELYAIEAPAEIEVAKAVYLRSSTLKPGTNYQVQVSTDLTNWSNYGAAFTATNANWRTTNYIDVGDWDRLFFRLQQQ